MFGRSPSKTSPIYLEFSAGIVPAPHKSRGSQTSRMKKIEAVLKISALDDFKSRRMP
jgi:hypothetical protein